MIGDGLPKVINVVRFPCGPDVIVDFAYQPGALFVFDERLNGVTPDEGFPVDGMKFERAGAIACRSSNVDESCG